MKDTARVLGRMFDSDLKPWLVRTLLKELAHTAGGASVQTFNMNFIHSNAGRFVNMREHRMATIE